MKKDKKIGFPSLILMSVTNVAGITFTASFGAIVATNDGLKGGVGIHILWIFVIAAIILFFCVWPYARLSRIHPKSNGAILQYTRASLGRYWGVVVGLLSVTSSSIGMVVLIVSMVRQNFGAGAPDGLRLVGPDGAWGSWGNLGLDAIGFLLVLLSWIIIFFGVRKLKIMSNIFSIITWSITGILMIIMIVAWAKNGNIGFERYADITKIDLSFKSFSSTFMTVALAFVGAESLIYAGKNVKNLKKNVSKALIITMIIVTLFYITFTVLLMAAVTDGFGLNPNLQIFQAFGGKTEFAKWGGFALILLTILMRFNSGIQRPLYVGSTLEPIAKQMYINPKFGKIDKHNIPIKAVILIMEFIVGTAILFLFIPDIIEGATGSPSPFNYATLSAATSVVLFLVFMIGIYICLLDAHKKRLKLKLWEYIGFYITLIFLAWQLVMWEIDLFESPITAKGNDQVQAIVGSVFKIVYIIGNFLLAWWMMRNHKKLLQKFPKGTEEHKEMINYEKMFVFQEDNLEDEDENSNEQSPPPPKQKIKHS